MSRDGSGVYHRPVGTDAVTDTTIESTKYNVNVADVEQDLNLPRPIVAGGTGANGAAQALVNLTAEAASQLVTNYDMQLWQPGSFYSATTATGAPVASHAFNGIAYCSDPPAYPPTNNNVVLEARDLDDTATPGAVWVRTKKAGVWSAWFNTNPVTTSPPGSPGVPPPNAPDNSFWWDATRGKLFVRYNDGNSTAWVEAVAVPSINPDAFVEITGDVMTGPLVLAADPTVPLGAATRQYADNAVGRYATRNYITGLTLSTAGGVIGFSIAPGCAADSTNFIMMALTSAYGKTTAIWAVGSGNGALDSGAIAANTWYHVHLIRRADTAVVDVLISLSATAPTLPPNYTHFRRLGSIRTNASSQWIKFIQLGDAFLWDVPITDASGALTSPLTLSVPPGVSVMATLNVSISTSTPPATILFSSPLITAQVANTPFGNLSIVAPVNGMLASGQITVDTSTISTVLVTGAALAAAYIITGKWIDRRGRDT